jgi:Holliday junction resolvase RusA-like endonuclease
LLRSVGDSLTDAGVWEDDSLVCKVTGYKVYDDTREAGALITVKPLMLI